MFRAREWLKQWALAAQQRRGVCANGRGGFNSLGQPNDARRFHALHQELKQKFKIRRTFLYGHSQGSFFSLYYAGEYPQEVDGVVAFASGVWTQTKLGKEGHHQAIVLLHGTQDPVVPYAQSVGAFQAYREAEYPILHLKSIGQMELKTLGVSFFDGFKGGKGTFVLFNRGYSFCALHQERPGQATGARANFYNMGIFKPGDMAGNFSGDIEIKNKILAEAFFSRQTNAGDHFPKRRKRVGAHSLNRSAISSA